MKDWTILRSVARFGTAILLVAWCAAAGLSAQVTSAELSGTVTDASDAVLPGRQPG